MRPHRDRIQLTKTKDLYHHHNHRRRRRRRHICVSACGQSAFFRRNYYCTPHWRPCCCCWWSSYHYGTGVTCLRKLPNSERRKSSDRAGVCVCVCYVCVMDMVVLYGLALSHMSLRTSRQASGLFICGKNNGWWSHTRKRQKQVWYDVWWNFRW